MDSSMQNILKAFYDIASRPGDYARQWKDRHRKNVIGYFCSYTPEEIILAADALPFRIFNSGEKITRADAHLQTYCCSLVRGALDDASTRLAHYYDVLESSIQAAEAGGWDVVEHVACEVS